MGFVLDEVASGPLTWRLAALGVKLVFTKFLLVSRNEMGLDLFYTADQLLKHLLRPNLQIIISYYWKYELRFRNALK